MDLRVEPWQRPAHHATGREAVAMLVAFAGDDVLTELALAGTVPETAPVDALNVHLHRYAEEPEWIDGFRTGPLRDLAAQQLPDLRPLDEATCCYTIRVAVQDPPDLAHLQLAWQVAASVARAGAVAVLDVYAHDWFPGEAVAALDAHRPFVPMREISVVAEAESVPGFGHPVHTRGMIKFGRPDLVIGVPEDQIGDAATILNQLGRMLAEGEVLEPGQDLRVEGKRVLTVVPYRPGGRIPDVALIDDGLLIVDAAS
ncbi:hypothetical protein QLQ12_24410 [Actinoplanes sp. NEAU-A12]|uniref:DUF4261 domain-containing protein n=1 Tax=Actinoplanes sandaracinus TaxID=3045177 RepID=A0ABT6WPX5_9ACTN|nr:hypothetical protein [Actinoplanes sandaracinus]MDI6101769.1 hypothetical protein [Actinoplanes sandaracinus]